MNRKHRADALFKPRGAFSFLIGILFWVGCDSPQRTLTERQATHNRSCREWDAKIEGIDTEIGLHYDQVYDVKHRAQAFGMIGRPLLDAAERHTNEIIRLRGQRRELYRLAQSERCTEEFWFARDDNWLNDTMLRDKGKAVRDPSQPEGYSLVDLPSDNEMMDILSGEYAKRELARLKASNAETR